MTLIQKQALQNYWDTVRPSGIDIAYCAVVVLAGLYMIMLPTMFDTYNLFSARKMLESEFGKILEATLASIDRLSFTNTIVTFMFWGIVGMIVYALVSSVFRALQRAEMERELASDDYVHPADFSKAKFWREELLESAITFCSFVLFGLVTAVLLLQLLPTATVHLRYLLNSADNLGLLPAIASIVLLFIGACLTMVSFKLWWHRHVLFQEAES